MSLCVICNEREGVQKSSIGFWCRSAECSREFYDRLSAHTLAMLGSKEKEKRDDVRGRS